jgi:hypothetical protein
VKGTTVLPVPPGAGLISLDFYLLSR